jgi:hypothetical protein
MMIKHKFLTVLIVLAAISFLSLEANAASIVAPSCSRSDVQGAINKASTGDTVRVPPGNCTWTEAVEIPNTKKLLLQGAGIGITVLTASSPDYLIQLNQSGSHVTGFELVNGYILTDGDGWRIDHCKFTSNSGGEGIFVSGQRETAHPTGLIDHCIFINTHVLVCGWAGLTANALWSQPLSLGSGQNVVYVEDCTFTYNVFGNAIDSNYGGRFVFRYNTLNDVYVEAHSVQGDNRASRKWEIYNNTFNQKNRAMWVPMFLRGGTGVVFNNVLTGSWTSPGIALDNVRSCEARGVSGKCDGSSPWDGNQPGGNGYPCRDQIGRSTDTYLWSAAKPYPPQALDPAYAWNNKLGASNVLFFQHNCSQSAAHIQSGRDFFNNVAKPGYTSYTYPHPLIQAWTPSTVAPPQNLHVVEVTP